MTRLFRVFVHIYMHHFDKMVALGAVSSDDVIVRIILFDYCH